MIVVKISMGMGNQMFQYAAARALSLEKNTSLKIDISTYGGYKLRKYELEECFGLQLQQVTADELEQYAYNHPVKRIWNKIVPAQKMRVLALPYEEPTLQRNLLAMHDFFIPPHKRKTYIEPHYYFDPNFFRASDDVYLQGYWMSWKYFDKYSDIIKKDFTINRSLVAHLDPLVAVMQQQQAVSIHIRRTDYTSAAVIALKGLTSMEFYRQAIAHINASVENPFFYVFSDDIQWVKENFPLKKNVVFVDNTISKSALEDFYLMTQCTHNIITNSTFSWWAAYLNAHDNKKVITPKKWYNNKIYDYKDVCPLSWIQIDA